MTDDTDTNDIEPTGADPDGMTDVAADGEERVPSMTEDDISHDDTDDDSFDPSDYPDAPTSGVPCYVLVAIQDNVWRFTTSAGILTATDVPAHVWGALEGWKRRGGYGDAVGYSMSPETDGDTPPALTVPVHDLRMVLDVLQRNTPEHSRPDAYDSLRQILDPDE